MKQNEFKFELNEDEKSWSVTGYEGKSEEVFLPASYAGMPVKTIGEDAFSYNIDIKRVVIPEGFTSIGESAFYNCRGLTGIKLPESLTSIGNWAFNNCEELTNINLPENLTSIGYSAFEGCTGITGIKLPESLASIGEGVFKGCTGLTTIRLSKNFTSIIPSSVEDCTELTEITVDENNLVFCSLDGVMFDKAMTGLLWFPAKKKGKYSVPDGIISITSGVFDDCTEFTGIYFPQSVLSIKDFDFNNDQLTDITVNESNPRYCSIDGVLFNKEKTCLMVYPINRDKTEYAVPDGIIDIRCTAFFRCKRLTSIALPESLELIDSFAFLGCQELKEIKLPANLLFVGESAFRDCPNLETVTLSRKTRIGCKAFDGFTGELVYRD